MKTFWHKTNGQVYGPAFGTLSQYQDLLRGAYGSLRGVTIATAGTAEQATRKLLFNYPTWDGVKWIKPAALID